MDIIIIVIIIIITHHSTNIQVLASMLLTVAQSNIEWLDIHPWMDCLQIHTNNSTLSCSRLTAEGLDVDI